MYKKYGPIATKCLYFGEMKLFPDTYRNYFEHPQLHFYAKTSLTSENQIICFMTTSAHLDKAILYF